MGNQVLNESSGLWVPQKGKDGASLVDIKQSEPGIYHNGDVSTADGKAFFGGVRSVPGGSNYIHVQLLNPSGSGVVVLVDYMTITPASTMTLQIGRYDTALTTLAKQWPNKLLDGPAGAAEIRSQGPASLLGVTDIARYRVLSATTLPIDFTRPYLLNEGVGLAVVNVAVGGELLVAFEGREL